MLRCRGYGQSWGSERGATAVARDRHMPTRAAIAAPSRASLSAPCTLMSVHRVAWNGVEELLLSLHWFAEIVRETPPTGHDTGDDVDLPEVDLHLPVMEIARPDGPCGAEQGLLRSTDDDQRGLLSLAVVTRRDIDDLLARFEGILVHDLERMEQSPGVGVERGHVAPVVGVEKGARRDDGVQLDPRGQVRLDR